MNYIDIHSHIHDTAFDIDRDTLIAEMKTRGFATITVGTDREESNKAIACAERYDNVWATIGMHPVDNKGEVFDKDTYMELAKHPKVVAIGECGLDYFRLHEVADQEEEKERQKNLFKEQIDIAVAVDKPLMLHGRAGEGMDAYEDMVAILSEAKKKYGERVRGNAHFFVGTVEIAQAFTKLGFTISFPGVITFTHMYDDVVRGIPLTSMHAETDSPYVAPVPYRGKRNSPLYVSYMYERIALLKGETVEHVQKTMVDNAQKMFHLTFPV